MKITDQGYVIIHPVSGKTYCHQKYVTDKEPPKVFKTSQGAKRALQWLYREKNPDTPLRVEPVTVRYEIDINIKADHE